MPSFQTPGPTCVTTEPPNDPGTLRPGRSAAPVPLASGSDHGVLQLHKLPLITTHANSRPMFGGPGAVGGGADDDQLMRLRAQLAPWRPPEAIGLDASGAGSATPNGSRTFFVGGAGNDQIGWNYIDRFGKIFKEEGISGFTRLNESHDDPVEVRAGAMPKLDIIFTEIFRERPLSELKIREPIVEKATIEILRNLIRNPLKPGEQLNLAGYSYGSVLQAHAALRLSELSIKVNTVILIGCPIQSSSELFSALSHDKNINKIIRYDIPKDLTSNPSSELQFIEAGWQNRDPKNKGEGPHFDLARPDDPSTPDVDEGKQTEERIRQLARFLKQQGVQ